jgi:hypothetical protein
MNYVKFFNINGVDTKQVACIELQGAPNAATEGAVGVLGMDVTSPTHEVYRCVSVKGSVYTWELLSAGMSIISATITGEGGETKTFPYDTLRIPNNYLVKPGDLILDKEGYLYQIKSLGADSCSTTYCGTHIGGMASGDKDYSLVVKDGQLQLVTESGAVVSNIEHMIADKNTLIRDESTGITSVRGVQTIGDTTLRLFVGTKDEYQALTPEQKMGLFAIITDDTAKKDIENQIALLQYNLEVGNVIVKKSNGLVAPTNLAKITISAADDGCNVSVSVNQMLVANVDGLGTATILFDGTTSRSTPMVTSEGVTYQLVLEPYGGLIRTLYLKKLVSNAEGWTNVTGSMTIRII